MSWWKHAFASPRTNSQALDRSQSQLASLRRQASRDRRALGKKDELIAALRSRVEEIETQLEQVVSDSERQGQAIERLTRSLMNAQVIEQADLDAVLPTSAVQD